jgi:hypothetical protein
MLKDKEEKKVFRLLVCSNCVSCENKKIVFRTRYANSSINIMKLTSCWIEKQERPLCFQISSFTFSSKNIEEEKVRPSYVKFLLFQMGKQLELLDLYYLDVIILYIKMRYIYVRNHPSYDVDDACKMGKANNIPERDYMHFLCILKV